MAEDTHTDHSQHGAIQINGLHIMSLPREIRDEMYTLAPVSPSPVIVWKGGWIRENLNHVQNTWITKTSTLGKIMSGVEPSTRLRLCDPSQSHPPLSLNLFFCTRVTSCETAHVFYRKTTFAFLGHHK